MRSLIMTVVKLLTLSILFSGCQSPSYERIEHCTVIESLDICRCSDYDFNIPEKINEPYDMPVSHCKEKRISISLEDWYSKIEPTRKAKRYLEESKSRKDFKKRLRKVSK